MIAVTIRILLRYASGILVAKGLLLPGDASELAADPELIDLLVAAVGFALAGIAEVWLWAESKWNKVR